MHLGSGVRLRIFVSFNPLKCLLELGKGKNSKKAKAAEPSKKDLHAVIVDILKEVDFNTVRL